MKLIQSTFVRIALLGIAWAAIHTTPEAQPIDREALVKRHNPTLTAPDFLSPFTVGNGNFAATVDVTGMQTFVDDYRTSGIMPNTLANWAWHSWPNPDGFKLEDAFRNYDVHGRQVGFATNDGSAAGKWLRANPHRFPLGQMGMILTKADGTTATLKDLKNIRQTLDLWTGVISSHFELEGTAVDVTTVAEANRDCVGFSIKSALLESGRLRPFIRFPEPDSPAIKSNPPLNYGGAPSSKIESGQFATAVSAADGSTASVSGLHFDRTWNPQSSANAPNYSVDVTAVPDSSVKIETVSSGYYAIRNDGAGALKLCFSFGKPADAQATADMLSAPASEATPERFEDALISSAAGWKSYWNSGGAIDFSGSTDPRAAELERRVILSQYLERVQTAGDVPSQETGLTVNTWFGKQHLEMTWWNEAHYFLWGRPELAERSMAWYQKILPVAEAIAKQRGYAGAVWPKMVGIDGRESPGGNPFIIWNQPHIIYMAELAYRAHPGPETLQKYKDLVLETAEGMASYAYYEKEKDRYVLGPPLWLAQEIYDQTKSQNPTYELAYWRWALGVAQDWRVRLGMARDAHYDDIINKISKLPVKDGKYVGLESIPDTWDNPASRQDHPSFLMADGFLPKGPLVDEKIMSATLDAVLAHWDFAAKIWGWDYPMIAMTAARLGEPEKAVEILLRKAPHDDYSAAGQVYQRDDLPMYLPANGSLLSAVAMMAAGWDGSVGDAPGFPKDGKWVVRSEGLMKMP